MAAQLQEKLVADRNGLGREEVLPNLRDPSLRLGPWTPGCRRRHPVPQPRRRQRRALELAARQSRQLSDRFDQRRHHARRKSVAQERTKAVFVHFAVAANDITDELLHARHVFAHSARRRTDAVGLHHHRFDLGKFHAESPELHLRVGAAKEFDVALAIEATEVACAIDTRIRFARRRERIRQKPRLRAAGKSHIAARHTDADPKLANLAVRDRPQAIVEEVHAVAGNGASDCDRLSGRHIRIRRDNRGLRGAVSVDQPPSWLRPTLDQLVGTCLPAKDEQTHCRHVFG